MGSFRDVDGCVLLGLRADMGLNCPSQNGRPARPVTFRAVPGQPSYKFWPVKTEATKNSGGEKCGNWDSNRKLTYFNRTELPPEYSRLLVDMETMFVLTNILSGRA